MSVSMNVVTLAGHITADPQLRYLPNNTPVCNFSLALNERWKGGDGQPQEHTSFIDCECFGNRGEAVSKFFAKGRPIIVNGSLRQERWEKDGKNHSKIKVVVQNWSFGGDKPKDDASDF